MRTMLTENTRNAVLVIESVDPQRHEVLTEAANTLARLISGYLNGQVRIAFINIKNREALLR